MLVDDLLFELLEHCIDAVSIEHDVDCVAIDKRIVVEHVALSLCCSVVTIAQLCVSRKHCYKLLHVAVLALVAANRSVHYEN